ncbi:hypothetical protein HK405_006239 [Cladochytrium tenue]|nr:hypothetical protein HK405_006239 [Cladochytrium tenue]
MIFGSSSRVRRAGAWLAAAVALAAGASCAVADSIVLTLGGENGGAGVNALQCNNGVATATINLQASINVNNIHAYQPMAELGLPTVTATFTLNGAPASLTLNNAFNVQTGSTASGDQWVFTLQDDGPHPGGQFNLGACTTGTTPTVTIAFSSSAITDAAGLPNGADGGPAVPLVNGPVTVVNALAAEFNGGANGAAATAATTAAAATTTAAAAGGLVTQTVIVTVTNTVTVGGAAATTSTSAAAAATTSAAAATGTTVTHTVNPGFSGSGWCGNNQFNTQLNLAVSSVKASIASACGAQPMAECGLPQIQVAITQNGTPVNVVSWGGGDQTANGNIITFTEADDMPYYGGGLTLDIACDYTNNPPATAAAGLTFTPSAVTTTVDLTLNDGTTTPATVIVVAA